MSNTSPRAEQIAARVEAFVRQTIIPYEQDPRRSSHGPADSLVDEMRSRGARGGRADAAHPRPTAATSPSARPRMC